MSKTVVSRPKTFQTLHQSDHGLGILNSWDIGTARNLEGARVEALSPTSSKHSFPFGLRNRPDELTRKEALHHARAIIKATGLPYPGPAAVSVPLETITLTAIADGRVFQRLAGTESGPILLEGSYTGGAPASVEARVLHPGDAEVVTWTTVNASPSGGTWSGSISTPQGGPYHVEVRASDRTDVTDSDVNQWFVGIWLVCYGQSNMSGMFSQTSSPPAAAEGTGYFDGTDFTAVPAANGVREMLNAIKSKTGVPVAALDGSAAGTSLSDLSKGAANTNFSDLAAQITAIGGDAEFFVWHQGEADGVSSGGTGKKTYTSLLTTLHADIVAKAGRTTAQMPMVLASLGRTTDATYGNDEWAVIQDALHAVTEDNVDIYHSHSNIDAALDDSVHWAARSYGEVGKRYAHMIAHLLGDEANPPAWYAASAADVDGETSDVTISHSLGTDFTPANSITGFEVSDDGTTWVAATGARQSASVIRLTHSTLGTGTRRLRYQYGKNPDITGAVVDNSSLAPPLNHTPSTIEFDGSATLPPPMLEDEQHTGDSGEE